MKPIHNTDIPPALWMKRFSREQLRDIATRRCVKRGRDKAETAANLANGVGYHGNTIRFKVLLFTRLGLP